MSWAEESYITESDGKLLRKAVFQDSAGEENMDLQFLEGTDYILDVWSRLCEAVNRAAGGAAGDGGC